MKSELSRKGKLSKPLPMLLERMERIRLQIQVSEGEEWSRCFFVLKKKKSVKSVRVTPGRLPLKVIQLGGDPRVDPEHTRETGGIISSGFRNTSLSPERI